MCYICIKLGDVMTIVFETRTTKKTQEGERVPLYLRLVDGRFYLSHLKTKIMVNPVIWDSGLGAIKKRAVCPEEEREAVDSEVDKLRTYIRNAYVTDKEHGRVKKGWLEKALEDYYSGKDRGPKKRVKKGETLESLFDKFLEGRDPKISRTKHYRVLERILQRYSEYVRLSQPHQSKYVFDVKSITTEDLNAIYDYTVNEYQIVKDYPGILEAYPETRQINQRGGNTITGIFKNLRAFFNWCQKEGHIGKNPFIGFEKGEGECYGTPIYLTKEELKQLYQAEFSDTPSLEVQRDIFVFQCNVGCRVGDMMRLTKRDVINGAIEYIPNKTIKESAKTVVVPLNSMARAIVEKYKDLPGDSLLPFVASQNYNYAIKDALKKAGITRLVTTLNQLTRKEEKRPIYEVASSHMARRTFIGNIYKQVRDQRLVSSLTGHSDGSRAFTRYRNINREMKQDLVNILD